MNYLGKPKMNAKFVFQTCIAKVRDVQVKARLELIENDIEEISSFYDMLGEGSQLYKFPPHASYKQALGKEVLCANYTDRMAKKGAPGRDFYDKLKSSVKYDTCPLCNVGTVATLDHYLPKAHYPIMSVIPLNLVPACRDCNTIKSDEKICSPEFQALHPYYDNIEKDCWLKAKVLQSAPPVVAFFVSPPPLWDDLLSARTKNHFSMFGLSLVYSVRAATEIVAISHRLKNLHKTGGEIAVRGHLSEEAISRRSAAPNSWQTATYEALAADNWFCSIGCLLNI